MTKQELLTLIREGNDLSLILTALKDKEVEVEEWKHLKRSYLPHLHEIVSNPTLRPNDKQDSKGKRDRVSKITYAAEMITARKFNQMMFTLPVKRKYKYDQKNETLKQIAEAIEAVYRGVGINGVNIDRFRAYFGACEVATMWYVVDKGAEHNDYGFPTKWKLRCRSYSPMERKFSKIPQSEIYPVFDADDDLIALSFEYTRSVAGNDESFFDTYTDQGVFKWIISSDSSVEVFPVVEVPIGKIQGVYWYTPLAVYEGLENNRNEIEFTRSRQSDIVRKNTAPIIKLIGDLVDTSGNKAPVTDKSREVYHLKNGGDVATVSPSISSDNIELFTASMKKNIDEETQMPNLSFDNSKSLGVTSGKALEVLLTESYMRIGEESHSIIKGFERECNIIKSFLGEMNVKWASLLNEVVVEHEIVPFKMKDKTEESERLSAEVGSQTKSRLQAIKEMGYTDDPEGALAQIIMEERELSATSVINDVFNTQNE